MLDTLVWKPVKEGEWQMVAKTRKFYKKLNGELQVVDVTPEKVRSWEKRFRERKNPLPLVKGHSLDSADARGVVEDIRVDGEGDDLSVYIKPRFEGFTPKESTSFSVLFEDDAVDSETGETVVSELVHVGITDYPIIKGLGLKQTALSQLFENIGTAAVDSATLLTVGAEPSDPDAEISLEDQSMKEIALALGLAEDATEAEVLDAIKLLSNPVDPLLKVKEAFALAIDATEADILAAITAAKETKPAKVDAAGVVAERKAILTALGLDENDFADCLDEKVIALEAATGKSMFALMINAQKLNRGQDFRSRHQGDDNSHNGASKETLAVLAHMKNSH